jgi:hypothetical protein
LLPGKSLDIRLFSTSRAYRNKDDQDKEKHNDDKDEEENGGYQNFFYYSFIFNEKNMILNFFIFGCQSFFFHL